MTKKKSTVAQEPDVFVEALSAPQPEPEPVSEPIPEPEPEGAWQTLPETIGPDETNLIIEQPRVSARPGAFIIAFGIGVALGGMVFGSGSEACTRYASLAGEQARVASSYSPLIDQAMGATVDAYRSGMARGYPVTTLNASDDVRAAQRAIGAQLGQLGRQMDEAERGCIGG